MKSNRVMETFVKDINQENVVYLDPHPLLILNSSYIRHVHEGQFLYRDDDHINQLGAQFVFDQLLKKHVDSIFSEHLKK